MLDSLFNKAADLKVCNFIKKRLQHRCFPVTFAKLLWTPFFTEHLRWLLLKLIIFMLQLHIYYLPKARWHNLVCVCVCVCVCMCFVCRWLSQWWLVFVLLEVDATLGDGCGILESLHSFREVKCLQGYSKILWMGI